MPPFSGGAPLFEVLGVECSPVQELLLRGRHVGQTATAWYLIAPCAAFAQVRYTSNPCGECSQAHGALRISTNQVPHSNITSLMLNSHVRGEGAAIGKSGRTIWAFKADL